MSAPSIGSDTPSSSFDDENFPRLRRKLIRYFNSHGVPFPEDEECASETILRVEAKIAAGERIENVDAYAMGVARNVLREYWRKDRTDRRQGKEATPEPPALAAAPAGMAAILRALDLLPQKERRLIERYYGAEDHIASRRKLAKRLRISSETLYVRVWRIRQKLLQNIRDTAPGPVDE